MPRSKKRPAEPGADRGHELLAACFAQPDDPAPREVYADWLEEQGHPFANVVRAKTDEDAGKLAAPHVAKWFGSTLEWFESSIRETLFERGMLRRAYGSTATYASKPAQATLLPIVSRFGARNTIVSGPSPRLGEAGTLAWTSSLSWWNNQLDDARAIEFAKSPHLVTGRLRRLKLEKLRGGNAALAAFAKAPAFANVTELELEAPVHLGAFDLAGVQGLLEALPLDTLLLRGPMSAKVHQLAKQPVFAKLRRFAMTAKPSRDIAALLASEHLTGLRWLQLGAYENLHDETLEPLFTNEALADLAELEIQSEKFHVSPAMQLRLRQRFTMPPVR